MIDGPALREEDRLVLRALVESYARRVDRRDGPGVAALFSEDGVLVSPDPADLSRQVERAGHDAVAGSVEALAGMVKTRHLVLAQELEPAGEGVLGTVFGEAHHLATRDDRVVDFAWTLRYLDRYVRQGDTWLISRRELQVDWIEHRPVRFVGP